MSSVAPLVGAWIEILYMRFQKRRTYVAPLVGAWIEILTIDLSKADKIVAPLVGAWIEMRNNRLHGIAQSSLPLWERGWKFEEMIDSAFVTGRSPCGSVD